MEGLKHIRERRDFWKPTIRIYHRIGPHERIWDGCGGEVARMQGLLTLRENRAEIVAPVVFERPHVSRRLARRSWVFFSILLLHATFL